MVHSFYFRRLTRLRCLWRAVLPSFVPPDLIQTLKKRYLKQPPPERKTEAAAADAAEKVEGEGASASGSTGSVLGKRSSDEITAADEGATDATIDTAATELALIDGQFVVSRAHLLAAAMNALQRAAHNEAHGSSGVQRMRTRSVGTEVIFSLSGSRSIDSAFSSFGIQDSSSSLIVVGIGDGALVADIHQVSSCTHSLPTAKLDRSGASRWPVWICV